MVRLLESMVEFYGPWLILLLLQNWMAFNYHFYGTNKYKALLFYPNTGAFIHFFSTPYLYLKSLTLHSHLPSLLSTSSSPSLGSGHRFNQILFNLRENYFLNSVSPSSYYQPISWLASHLDFWKVWCTLSMCFSIFYWLLQGVSIWLLMKLFSEKFERFYFPDLV